MKTIFLSSLFLISTIGVTSQTIQQRETKPFKRMELSGAVSVVYTQSDTLSLKVEGNSEEADRISTTIQDGILTIKAKGSFSHPYKIYVSGSTLNHIMGSGASKFVTTNVLTADSLSFDISGASDISAHIKTKVVDVLLSGASGVSLDGNTQSLYATVSGASALKAYKLMLPIADVTVSGASSAKVFVTEKISAKATGSSTVKFKGDPKDVSAEASSSSSITKVVDDELSKKTGGDKDSTTFNFKKRKFVIINKEKENQSDTTTSFMRNNDFHHWAGFAMGVNGWLSNGSTALPKQQEYMRLNYGKSLNFQLNFFERDIHIYKDYVNLVLGLGFEWNHYEFSNRTKLNADSSYTYGIIDSTNAFTYKKNRLKTTFINVPLLVEFNTSKNPKKTFHLALGVIGGYKIGSRTRQILEQKSNDIKLVRKDDYNINPFRVNAHASIGFHDLTVFADYALTDLFEKGKGPALHPFTIGVKLVTF